MRRPLDEIRLLQERYQVPIVYAGDVVNRYDISNEAVNFAIRNLPPGYAICGQHDMPHHRYGDLHRSAYWTLVEAGTIRNLAPGKPEAVAGIVLHGFPWGSPITPLKEATHSLCLDVAVIHKSVYTRSTAYKNAPEDGRLKYLWPLLAGYDAVHFGDNHKFFCVGKCFNPGSMMVRASDQYRCHRPCIGILYVDGTWGQHFLDTSQDKCLSDADKVLVGLNRMGKEMDATPFIDSLGELSDSRIDFQEELLREAARRDTTKGAMGIIDLAMGGE